MLFKCNGSCYSDWLAKRLRATLPCRVRNLHLKESRSLFWTCNKTAVRQQKCFLSAGWKFKRNWIFSPPFSQGCTDSKANVNMRLTSLRWETDPVRWTQTCASKYRRLGRAFASARIIASMNEHGDSVYPLLDVTVGSLTRWRETFVFKPQGTTTIYVAAKGSVKSLTNILKKNVFLPPPPSVGPALLFPLLCFWLFPLKLKTAPPH